MNRLRQRRAAAVLHRNDVGRMGHGNQLGHARDAGQAREHAALMPQPLHGVRPEWRLMDNALPRGQAQAHDQRGQALMNDLRGQLSSQC